MSTVVVVIFAITTQLLHVEVIKARITVNIAEVSKIFSLFLTRCLMGRTGYSAKESVNNIDAAYLRWELHLIFDESQKKGKIPKRQGHEIWIDVYPLTRFLAKHSQAAVKVEGTKEWVRTNGIVGPKVEEYEA